MFSLTLADKQNENLNSVHFLINSPSSDFLFIGNMIGIILQLSSNLTEPSLIRLNEQNVVRGPQIEYRC